jgi:transcriptional regulator GlxA family with amidase domain
MAFARPSLARAGDPGGGQRSSEGSHPLPVATQWDVHARLAALPSWVTGRLHENLSVRVLALRAGVCPRHFSRLFKQTFATTPAEFVEQLRIEEAETRLTTQKATIDQIAAAVGFRSTDVFRRAFRRRRGLTPAQFRKRRGAT